MRLFVAINLPDDVRSEVWRATEELRGHGFPVRWVGPERLHLTVKFLGNVDPHLVSDIESQLAETAGEARAHSVGIEGMGVFPSARRPNTVWAGCEPVPVLELLHHGVERRLASLGFPVEGRPFRPHVTVGRVKRRGSREALAGLEQALDRVSLSTVTMASSVELMESQLGAGGPTYRVVRSFGFAP